MSEKIKTPSAKKIFNAKYYLTAYEAISMPPDSRYMLSAYIQHGLADITGALNGVSTIADLGCGTGNPTFYFAGQSPDTQVFGVDMSGDALQIARYKFGQMPEDRWSTFTRGMDIPDDVSNAIESRRTEALPYQNRVHFIQGLAEALPVASIDLILGVQFFHWPKDTSQTLQSMRSALKTNKYAIFDTSGLQLKWGERTYGQSKIDQLHPMKHPFHLKFIEILNSLLNQQNLPQLDPNKLHGNHYKFTVDQIIQLAKEAGFEPVGVEQSAYTALIEQIKIKMPSRDNIISSWGYNCNGVLIPLSPDEFKEWIVGAGQMRYFNIEGLQNLSEAEKQALINTAYEQTEAQYQNLLKTPVMESLAYFVLRAV